MGPPSSLASLLRHTVALLVAAAVAVEGRGGSRRRARQRGGKKSRAGKKEDKKTKTPWSNWINGDSKSIEALKVCDEKTPLPPERGGPASSMEPPAGDQWRYLQLPANGQHPEHGEGLVQVDWTQSRESLCRDLFAGRKPPASIAFSKSSLTCVLSSSKDEAEEEALFAADYNSERGLPNFVAFVLPGRSNTTVVQSAGSKDPASAASFFDVAYAAGKPEPCCWCAEGSGKVDAEGSPIADAFDCGEEVAARGHLVPLSTFSIEHAAAADVFLNTVPVRKPFIELQWARRLQELFDNGHHIRKKDRRLHVMMGPSLQSDGRLPATIHSPPDAGHESSARTSEVPSFLWSAYADPFAIAAGGHFCRNGGADDACACVDNLKLSELELRLGFHLFPGMNPAPIELAISTRGQPSGFFFFYSVAGILTSLVLMVLCIITMAKAPSKDRPVPISERHRLMSSRAKKEAEQISKNMRAELEMKVGGKEALRARFKNV